MTQNISILGSTGSIGTQALDVAEMQNYKVVALTANSNVKKLAMQVHRYKPLYCACADEKSARELKIAVADTSTRVLSGVQGVCECASIGQADTVLNSIVGMAGLEPTLKCIEAGKTLALANKETLVAGGTLVTNSAKKNNVQILPVDSEHSAIFQALQGSPGKDALKKIILTASGGPFFGKTKKELENVTLEEALNHPNWSMGAKITVDSATMMNKGLELIEAVRLFDVSPDDIEVVVHRESILHSAIVYKDNSVIGQMGVPDMRIPIQYALTYPERIPSPVKELSFTDIGSLTFFKPDTETFSLIELCRMAVKKGGLYPAIANAVNEEANLLFRQGKIKFLQIADFTQKAINTISSSENYDLKDIISVSEEAKSFVRSLV